MTESDQIRPPGVSDRQSIAIDALVSGATHREAAEKAGVQRTTVTEWCNKNIPFIAERNRRREERLAASGELLHEATAAALKTIWTAVDGGDIGASFRLLRIVGVDHLLGAARPGATTHLGATTDLAMRLEIDLLGDIACNPQSVQLVEDASAETCQ